MQSKTLDFIAHACQAAPSADNSQPWKFSWNGYFFTISLTKNNSATHILSNEHPAMLLSLGCAYENMLQALQSIGISDIRVQFLPKELSIRSKLEEKDLDRKLLKKKEEIALFKRHTNRFPFMKRKILPHIKEKLLHFHNKKAKVQIFDTPKQIDFWSEQIKKASEVRFRSKDIHEWLGTSLRLSETEVLSNDGLDVKTFDLPPGGKQLLAFTKPWPRMKLLNKFGLYKIFALVESQQLKKTACLVAITAPLNNSDIVDAGILMERVWIYLNDKGLSVHPYFVLSDQMYRYYNNLVPKELVHDVKSLVNNIEAQGFSKDNHIQIILRVGSPRIDPFRSSRRHTPHIDYT